MAQRGFTLLELLVVLAIIGVMLLFIPGFVLRGQPGLDVEVAARAIADALREARSEALLRNREQLFALDVEERLFRAGAGAAAGADRPRLEVTFQTARSELMSESIGQIRFFADGSSTGGRIGLARDGRQADGRRRLADRRGSRWTMAHDDRALARCRLHAARGPGRAGHLRAAVRRARADLPDRPAPVDGRRGRERRDRARAVAARAGRRRGAARRPARSAARPRAACAGAP